MTQVKLVAATGPPLNNAGCMLPIFRKKDDKFFEVGGQDFSTGALKELVKEKAAVRLRSTVPKGAGFNVKELRWSSEIPDHYGFPAYVLYLSKEAVACLGGEEPIVRIGSEYDAVRSWPTKGAGREWDNHLFLLISREGLVSGVVPEVTKLCMGLIDKTLIERILDRNRTAPTLVDGERDELAQLAQIMMNLASRDTLDDAIRYYGSMLLLSPLAKNFRVWLNMVLDRWQHPVRDVGHWKDMAAGVHDAAEQRADVLSGRERREQAVAIITYTGQMAPKSRESRRITFAVERSGVTRGYFQASGSVYSPQPAAETPRILDLKNPQQSGRKKQLSRKILYTEDPIGEREDTDLVYPLGETD